MLAVIAILGIRAITISIDEASILYDNAHIVQLGTFHGGLIAILGLLHIKNASGSIILTPTGKDHGREPTLPAKVINAHGNMLSLYHSGCNQLFLYTLYGKIFHPNPKTLLE